MELSKVFSVNKLLNTNHWKQDQKSIELPTAKPNEALLQPDGWRSASFGLKQCV